MNHWTIDCLSFLGRTECGLTLVAICTLIVFWKIRGLSSTVRRCFLVLVLMQGWIVVPWVVEWTVPATPEMTPIPINFESDSLGKFDPALLTEPLMETVSPDREQPNSTPDRSELLSLLLFLWIVGMLGIVANSAWRYRKFVRHIPSMLDCPQEWAEEWRELQVRAGRSPNVPMLLTGRIGPLLCKLPGGYRLLIPKRAWSNLTAEQRRTILQHELAHLTRRDLWKSFGMRLLALPHWFNPLVWWVVREFEYQAELACDKAALQDQPELAGSYARALLTFVDSSQEKLLLGSAASGRGLSDRVRTLFVSQGKETTPMKLICITTLLAAVAVWNCTEFRLVAEEPPKETSKSQPETDFEPTQQSASGESEKLEDTDSTTNVIAPEKQSVSTKNFTFSERFVTEKRVAVVDIKYLFEHLDSFERGKNQLKQDVQKTEANIREKVTALKAIQDQIKKLGTQSADHSEQIAELQEKMEHQKAKLELTQITAKQNLVKREAELYEETYNRITAAVKEHAQKNGIRLVRKADLSESREDTKNEDPKSIIRRMNQEVVYIERDELDITDAILKRLQEADAAQTQD